VKSRKKAGKKKLSADSEVCGWILFKNYTSLFMAMASLPHFLSVSLCIKICIKYTSIIMSSE